MKGIQFGLRVYRHCNPQISGSELLAFEILLIFFLPKQTNGGSHSHDPPPSHSFLMIENHLERVLRLSEPQNKVLILFSDYSGYFENCSGCSDPACSGSCSDSAYSGCFGCFGCSDSACSDFGCSGSDYNSACSAPFLRRRTNE